MIYKFRSTQIEQDVCYIEAESLDEAWKKLGVLCDEGKKNWTFETSSDTFFEYEGP